MQEPAASRRLLAVKIAVDVTTRLPLCGRMRRISRCHQQRGSPQITADAQAKQAEAQCINTEVRVAQAEALHKPRRCSSQLIASGTSRGAAHPAQLTSRGAAHSSSSSVAQAETQLITSPDTLAESQRITAVAQAAEQAADRSCLASAHLSPLPGLALKICSILSLPGWHHISWTSCIAS